MHTAKLKYSCCDLGSRRPGILRGSRPNRVFTCFEVGELAPGSELWAFDVRHAAQVLFDNFDAILTSRFEQRQALQYHALYHCLTAHQGR